MVKAGSPPMPDKIINKLKKLREGYRDSKKAKNKNTSTVFVNPGNKLITPIRPLVCSSLDNGPDVLSFT